MDPITAFIAQQARQKEPKKMMGEAGDAPAPVVKKQVRFNHWWCSS